MVTAYTSALWPLNSKLVRFIQNPQVQVSDVSELDGQMTALLVLPPRFESKMVLGESHQVAVDGEMLFVSARMLALLERNHVEVNGLAAVMEQMDSGALARAH